MLNLRITKGIRFQNLVESEVDGRFFRRLDDGKSPIEVIPFDQRNNLAVQRVLISRQNRENLIGEFDDIIVFSIVGL